MRVAIVTRTKDRGTFLARARDSLAAQQYGSIVWSIVNDGGETGPVEREAELARNAGIETIVTHLAENRGRAGAANAGIEAVKCDAIILLDDDDRLLPGAVGRLAETLMSAPPNDIGAAAQVWQVSEALAEGEWIEVSRRIANAERGPVRIIDLAYRNFVPVCGLIFKRSVFDKLGGFNDALPVVEDWDFLIRAIQIGDIGKIDVPVAEYFVRSGIDDENDPHANSVAAGHGLHVEWEARVRNMYLREDLNSGRAGMGHLMNPQHRLPMERINTLAEKVNALPNRSWIARKILRWVRK
jgi:glycosyltransferase involved in cell wall biosynthesis